MEMLTVKMTLLLMTALLLFVVPANARSLGETFDCRFPKAGHVVIDTREPGASITVDGKRYAARDGSYFYQTDDDDVLLFFGPGFRRWTYNRTNEAVMCKQRQNRR